MLFSKLIIFFSFYNNEKNIGLRDKWLPRNNLTSHLTTLVILTFAKELYNIKYVTYNVISLRLYQSDHIIKHFEKKTNFIICDAKSKKNLKNVQMCRFFTLIFEISCICLQP